MENTVCIMHCVYMKINQPSLKESISGQVEQIAYVTSMCISNIYWPRFLRLVESCC